MVSQVIDPVKVPSITLSEAEIEEIQDQIDARNLPSDFLKRYKVALEANVFGEGFQRGKDGQPIEMGQGSPSNMTRNSIDAYIKNQMERRIGGPEPGFEEHLKRMRAQLAESEPRQKAAAEARRQANRDLKQKFGRPSIGARIMVDITQMSAADRRRAFEDAVLGPDVARPYGQIEDGPGSKFSSLPVSDQEQHRALCSLCVAEHLLAMAAAEHARLDGVHKAALAKVSATARRISHIETSTTTEELA